MDKVSKKERSRIMSLVTSKNTGPERILIKFLRKCGYKFKTQYSKEHIDVAFPEDKIAIFVDGCFWHSCPVHLRIPKSNVRYWKAKLAVNLRRAKEKDKRLKADGWIVMHIWEHELVDPKRVIRKISRKLRK